MNKYIPEFAFFVITIFLYGIQKLKVLGQIFLQNITPQVFCKQKMQLLYIAEPIICANKGIIFLVTILSRSSEKLISACFFTGSTMGAQRNACLVHDRVPASIDLCATSRSMAPDCTDESEVAAAGQCRSCAPNVFPCYPCSSPLSPGSRSHTRENTAWKRRRRHKTTRQVNVSIEQEISCKQQTVVCFSFEFELKF